MSAVVPDFSDDPDAYVGALLALMDAHPVKIILPSHDGSIETIRARRAEFERRTAVPLAQEPGLDVAQSKPKTLELAQQLGIPVPRSILISDMGDVPRAAADLGYPVVIKPVRTWAERDGVGTRLSSEVAVNLDELQRRVSDIHDCGGIVMFQEWLPGRREAVSFFYAAGQIWALFVQISYREFPVLGGASVLCESIAPLPELVEPAERLVRAMNLDGCSMVEFRRDTRGRPVLMEVNARMPGSIALSHAAGIDFPKLIYDWALGRPLERVAGYQVGRRLRWLGGDVWNLKCAFERDGHPDSPSPSRAVATFLLDFVRRPSPLDIVDLSDMAPALVDLRQMVMKPALAKLRSLAFGDRPDEPRIGG